mgnify:CR=1 FL=1
MTTPNNNGEEIKRVSDTMDILAKLIIQRRQISTQTKLDYDKKLQEVDKLINMILALNRKDDMQQVVDTTALDKILNDGVEIIERDNDGIKQKFALIPICDHNESDEITISKKKKKKNKINCSYCKETGHTRAACPKRLMNPKA